MIRQSVLALTAMLVLLLVWSPLPFGSVTTWAEASVEILAFLALALAMLAMESVGNLRHLLLPALALAAVALFGILQSVPLPDFVVRSVAPGLVPLERQADAVLGGGGPMRLTLALPATLSASLSWAAACACLFSAGVVGRRRIRRRWLGGAILATALGEVFFGARAANAGERTLWGVEVPIAASRLRGTFFNPNHLALYLEIALAIAFAWGWWMTRQASRQTSLDRKLLPLVPPVMVWLTLFAGLVFTQSRGALIAALVGVLLQGALLATVGRRIGPAVVGLGLGIGGIAVALAMGLQAGPARMLSSVPLDVSLGARRQAWSATLALWHRSPLTGMGLGTLRDTFTLVQPASLSSTWFHAHSDPIEILATSGLVGAALLAVGLVALIARLLRVLREGRRSEDRAAGLAALGALAAVGLHECFDFGLTIPANALTLAVLLGAGAAARLGPAQAAVAIPPAGSSEPSRAGRLLLRWSRTQGDARPPQPGSSGAGSHPV
jgi:O-antigen ligase